MTRYLRLWAAFFRNCITREMEYRGHFFMQFMIDIVWYGVQIALFEVIYLNTSSVAGFTRPEVIVFLGSLFVIDALNMVFFSQNFWMFPRLIVKGDLDFYLIKPVSVVFMSFTRFPNVASWLNLVVGISVLVYGLMEAQITLTAGTLALFLLLVVCGNIIMVSLQILVASIAIFLVQADGIQMLFHSVYQFATRPDAIYSRMFRRVLLYVFPLALIASVPSQALLGVLSPGMAVWNVAAAGILLFLAVKTFNWSLSHYSGASA
jgi:ABC-2 type transport system permease protein